MHLPDASRDALLAPVAAPAGPLARARFGARLVLEAARLVARDRDLRRAALLPVLLTAVACGGLAALATWLREEGEQPGWFAHLHAFMATFVALSSMPPTFLMRWWTRVALEARRALGFGRGEDPNAGRGWARLMAREWAKAGRQAVVVAAGLSPLLLLLIWAPDGTWALIGGVWAFYWVVVDALELPVEVIPGPRPGAPVPWFTRGLGQVGSAFFLFRPLAWAGRLAGRLSGPWREEIHLTERRPWECLGFGLAAGLLLATPVLGLAFRAVAITAAAALVGEASEG